MRIYKNSYEAIKEVERDLAEMGIQYQSTSVQDKDVRGNDEYMTKELSPYAYTITNPCSQLKEMILYKKEEEYFDWCFSESLERLSGFSGQNPGDAWKKNADLWRPFIQEGFFSYTYSERWSEQLPYVIAELKRNPESRQVTMTMYDRHQDMRNWGGKARVPCSMTYSFLKRNNKLSLTYTQRSCDFYQFYPADVYFSVNLLTHVATLTDSEIGNFNHFIVSLHAFKKDMSHIF